MLFYWFFTNFVPVKIILAIETSCDDTSASVCIDGKIASNVAATQVIHAKHGGVIPELASRAHDELIIPVILEALENANTSLDKINAIAVTEGPGLMGSLLVGVNVAKGLAFGLNIPIITIHHMHAHIMAHFIDEPIPDFPFLCLTVSGGHSQIVLMKSHFDLEILGNTIDDAAGEAFDKAAKLLGLPYPGGPYIDTFGKLGNHKKFTFSKPRIDGFNYSFSGFKTSLLYFLQKQDENFIVENLNDLCASVNYTIVEILLDKFKKAVKETGVKNVALAGGVSANSYLREMFKTYALNHKLEAFIPNFQYCTDNAGMIAITGWYKFLEKRFAANNFSPKARIPLITENL